MRQVKRTVLVTGAGSGIGAAIARRFLAEGDAVGLFDIDEEAAARVSVASGSDSHAVVLTGDASDGEHVRSAVQKLTDAFGAVDILINNVGIELNGTVLEQSLGDWERQLAVNLTSVFHFTRCCIPGMRSKRKGAVINISSVHASASWPRCSAYDATKSGMIGLTRALAIDHGPEGIRVNAISPGYIRTPLLQEWFNATGGGEESAALRHPLRRIGEPQDIADAAFFLASDEASFITGTNLNVDGGLLAAGQ